MTSAKKKIAYIVNSLNLGGTENLVVQMSYAFQSEYDVFVICLDNPGIWAAKLRDEKIPVYCFWRQPGIDLAMAIKIAGFCKKHAVDLIHAHQSTPWFYAALSRLFYRAPKLLFEEHGRFYPEHYSWKKNVINKCLIQHLTDKFIAVSKDVRLRLVQYEGVSATRIQVIYNGVHRPSQIGQERRAKLRLDLGLSPDDFVVGTVGRLDPIKNLPMFLRAFTEAKLQHTQLKGLLVGDGPEFSMLKTMCGSLRITENIIMTGYRQDATDLLQCMDIFILCSFSEGTSMALLEAMASGVPTIVTDVGGNPELITHNISGWVIPSDSSKDLAAAISEACGTPEKRACMSEVARHDYETHYSFTGMIDNYHSLYAKLLMFANKRIVVKH